MTFCRGSDGMRWPTVFDRGVFPMSNSINTRTNKTWERQKEMTAKNIYIIILYLFLLNSHLFLSSWLPHCAEGQWKHGRGRDGNLVHDTKALGLENNSVKVRFFLTFIRRFDNINIDRIRIVLISRTPVGVISQVPDATANQRREIQT